MPTSLPPRKRPVAAKESFLFKAILVGSAVWLAAFVLISAEQSLQPQQTSAAQDETSLMLMAALNIR